MNDDQSMRDAPPLSRRRFIKTAVAGGAAMATSGSLAEADPQETARRITDTADPLKEQLLGYGSELGNIKQTT